MEYKRIMLKGKNSKNKSVSKVLRCLTEDDKRIIKKEINKLITGQAIDFDTDAILSQW